MEKLSCPEKRNLCATPPLRRGKVVATQRATQFQEHSRCTPGDHVCWIRSKTFQCEVMLHQVSATAQDVRLERTCLFHSCLEKLRHEHLGDKAIVSFFDSSICSTTHKGRPFSRKASPLPRENLDNHVTTQQRQSRTPQTQ